MADMIISGIVILLIGLAIAYIVKAKKNGVKCIGCSGSCSGSCAKNCSGCPSQKKETN